MSIYNNRITKKMVVVIVSSALLFSSLALPLYSSAQQGGSGLSISPTRTELSLLPGSTDKVTVTIKNITSGVLDAQVFVNDFEPDNVTGEPRLVVDPDKKNAASISSFISGLKDVELEPGASQDVTVDISIPENAAPGGYYGALRFKAVPASREANSANNQVSLTANILSLLLIEVPGDVEQKVAVNSISAYLKNEKGSLFTNKPDTIGVEISNFGNGFVKPFGRVMVKNFKGNEIFGYELNDSNPRSNVLPNSSRVFSNRFVNVIQRTINGVESQEENSPITFPGRYTLSVDASYGNGGQVFTVTSIFWYIPMWFILSTMTVMGLILVGGYLLYRKYRTRSTRRRR